MENAEPVNPAYDFDLNRLPATLPIADTIANEHDCSYLPDKNANLPLKLPGRRLTLDEFDFALSKGIRRSGMFLYHTACRGCTACEPTRVDVHAFDWRDSFRRVLHRGDRDLEVRVAHPTLDETRLSLFNQHRATRGLGEPDHDYRSNDYESFLVNSCCAESVELSYWIKGILIAVSIVDCGRISLSAVYTYFDPGHSKYSLGTYSILKQVEFARATQRQYLYLGMYVAQNPHLNYKSRFTPHERFVQGSWKIFLDDRAAN
ncbi:MAG: arginyltransferase [Pirellula sp.]